MKTFFFAFLSVLLATACLGQSAKANLKFVTGQTFEVKTMVKSSITQEVMGQSMDINIDATVLENYSITNSSEENTSIHHSNKKLNFSMEMMGKGQSFDSDNQKDLEGPAGPEIKSMIAKAYDMIISPEGIVMDATSSNKSEEQAGMTSGILKGFAESINTPKQGASTFFKVLPNREIKKGDSWSDSSVTDEKKSSSSFVLKEISETTITVSELTKEKVMSTTETQGMQITNNLENTITGIILIDKATGIVQSKNYSVETTGTAEVMGSSIPITSKTTISMSVSLAK